ncbi:MULTISPECIES: hypothetical protein [unclassified Ectothiorhodospira]|uniref:hypothetical protein n=1 Tax=unclassified Ectothiorhodospira TaxID=2684909 RepID=UPI001EE8DD1A|nr:MULTISPECIES: hypothetical protein [unclassified Ectothiorhodospira]MCG5515038.1 hypothetical protein [Ectothiorhodospira sp. 9100]MCG5517639.1 hypothetical protein [Ectothiorhodospira sp. 9905]
MPDLPETPSTAARPDLDWSQVRETVMMLQLAVAQIERTMRDGNDSVETLTASFTHMVGKTQVIHAAADGLEDSQEKQSILENCSAVESSMSDAIVAFQFYDRLSQRLSHIGNSLEGLAELVSDSRRLYNPYEWSGLQSAIRAKYTNEPDRAMFDAMLAGASIEEALKHSEPSSRDDDIELF